MTDRATSMSLLRLLAAVAWADGTVQEEEERFILKLAGELGVSMSGRREIEGLLLQPLGREDFEKYAEDLNQRVGDQEIRLELIDRVRMLANSDLRGSPEETVYLDRLREVLQVAGQGGGVIEVVTPTAVDGAGLRTVEQTEVLVAVGVVATGAAQELALEVAAGGGGEGGVLRQVVGGGDDVVPVGITLAGADVAVGFPGPGLGQPVEVATGAVAHAAGELAVVGVAAQAGVAGVAVVQQVGVAVGVVGIHQLAVLAVVHGMAAGAFGDAAIMEGQNMSWDEDQDRKGQDAEQFFHDIPPAETRHACDLQKTNALVE